MQDSADSTGEHLKHSISTGVVCVASSPKYVLMLQPFLDSIVLHSPSTPIVVYTKFPLNSTLPRSVINKVHPELVGHWDDKIRILESAPFDKIIYMDVDMIVLDTFVKDIELGLEGSDLVIRSGMCFNIEWEKRVAPRHLSQFNTGIFGIRKEVVESFVQAFWRFRNVPEVNEAWISDQIPFRAAALTTGLRVQELNSDFNFMGGFQYVVDRVRIVHFAGSHYLMNSPKRLKICQDLQVATPGTTHFAWKPIYQHKHFKPLNVFYLVSVDILLQVKFYIYRVYKRITKS